MTRREDNKSHNEEKIEFLRNRLRKPVVLVGMMGVGKTAIGQKLAGLLALDFIDSDRVVEEKAGRSVAEIFELDGEEKFRQAERNTVLETIGHRPCVLATGGGAIINKVVRKTIKSKAISVWLKLDVTDILGRLQKTDSRPLLRRGDPEKILKDLLAARRPFYAEADIHIDCRDGKPSETAEMVINSLYEYLKNDTV